MKFSRKFLKFQKSNKRFFSFNNKKDYYKILGIDKGSSQTDIKKAFARKARKYHPDTNNDPSSKNKFSGITEAYETLSNSQKRKIYDQYGMGSDEQKQYGSMGGFDGGQGFGDFGNVWGNNTQSSPFDDIFDSFFNQ